MDGLVLSTLTVAGAAIGWLGCSASGVGRFRLRRGMRWIALPGTLKHMAAGRGKPGLLADALGYVSLLTFGQTISTTLLTTRLRVRLAHRLSRRVV